MQHNNSKIRTYLSLRLLCRVGIFLLILAPVSLSTSFANNITQPKVNNNPEISHAIEIKNALSNSQLPLINEITELYEAREHNLIWSDGFAYNPKAHQLLDAIKNARKVGLNPADYDLEVIEYFLETTIDDPNIISRSDITFTHAYVKIAGHIDNTNALDLSDEFKLLNDDTFLTASINQPIKAEAAEPIVNTPTLNTPSIQQDHYSRLLAALEKYRNTDSSIEPIVLHKKSFTIGDISPEIIKARTRLAELGDYKNPNLTNAAFDETLALAISSFQIRHGLEADGILGKRTTREINKSFQDRALQLEVNLERAKQISEYGNDRYILVNVPEYKLYVMENGKSIYETRVVVGKKIHKTPVISSEITEFVLNPYWNVPNSITKNEIIPKLQEDPYYLYKNNMKLISRQNNQNIFLNPEFVDWTNIDPVSASLRIRQDPGKKNALGRVKFLFPNNHRVYLHDTPSRSLFSRNTRAFSHGCVRVENPLEFAEVLISNSNEWTNEKLDYFAQREKTKTIKLDQPIPILITYMTAWADEQGIVNFRPDIYKRDSQIANNLYNAEK